MNRLVLASRNVKKAVEMRRILAEAGLDIEVRSVADFDGAVSYTHLTLPTIYSV